MTKLVVATRNQGKLKEFRAVLANLPIQVLSLDEVGLAVDIEPEEIGETFAAVVEAKVRAYGQHTKLLTVADDSGLMIDALDGKPGVHSKRFFAGSDTQRNQKVLELLREKPHRSANFVSTLGLYFPETSQVKLFEGRIDGKIADSIRGTAGFGYDPIFIPEGYDKTFGELGIDVKNQLSHRARALQKLKEFLRTLV